MRAGVVLMGLLLAPASIASHAHAQAASCSKGDFESVVDQAAASLRDLTRQNTPQFQAKLRQLKDKRSWSNDQFMKEAEPFVRDDAIAGFDQKSEEFLSQIMSGGQSQSASATPDWSGIGHEVGRGGGGGANSEGCAAAARFRISATSCVIPATRAR